MIKLFIIKLFILKKYEKTKNQFYNCFFVLIKEVIIKIKFTHWCYFLEFLTK